MERDRYTLGELQHGEYIAAGSRFLKENFPDADIPLTHSGLLMLVVARLFQNDCETSVHRPLGLSWTGFSALFTLAARGSREAGYLARVAGVSRQAMSQTLVALERDRLVRRVDGKDKRTQSILLTEEGLKVALAATQGQVEKSSEWFGVLEVEERDQFFSLMFRVLAHNRERHTDKRRHPNGGSQ